MKRIMNKKKELLLMAVLVTDIFITARLYVCSIVALQSQLSFCFCYFSQV